MSRQVHFLLKLEQCLLLITKHGTKEQFSNHPSLHPFFPDVCIARNQVNSMLAKNVRPADCLGSRDKLTSAVLDVVDSNSALARVTERVRAGRLVAH